MNVEDLRAWVKLRDELYQRFIGSPEDLVIDGDLTGPQPDGDVYLSSHECQDCHDEIWLELWASPDNEPFPDDWFVGWYLSGEDGELAIPVSFCPFCGRNLYKLNDINRLSEKIPSQFEVLIVDKRARPV